MQAEVPVRGFRGCGCAGSGGSGVGSIVCLPRSGLKLDLGVHWLLSLLPTTCWGYPLGLFLDKVCIFDLGKVLYKSAFGGQAVFKMHLTK